jgi:hypothetical protein
MSGIEGQLDAEAAEPAVAAGVGFGEQGGALPVDREIGDLRERVEGQLLGGGGAAAEA